MNNVSALGIKDYLFWLLILLIGIPSLSYWVLFFTYDLPFITYIINSMVGCLTIISLVLLEFYAKSKRRIISMIILMIILFFTIIFLYYSFNWISQETLKLTLTATHLAEAGFSLIFGICIALSLRLIIFREKKKDWSDTTNNIKDNLKNMFSKYGNYFVIISIFVGIGFLILAQVARGQIDFNEYAELDANRWLTIGFSAISIGIALISIKIAIESGNRMDTIGDGEIKQSLINIQEIRKEYTYGLDEYLKTPKKKKLQPNIDRLLRINIFTTWLQFENIQKMIIYKKYMTPQQTSRLFRYHKTLMDFVLPRFKDDIVTNESVIQLLSGITKLYENFDEPNKFHEKFYEVLRPFVGQKQQDEEFIDYIIRKKQELKARGMYNLFRPIP